MTGELIPTGVTYGVGRNSINESFSGTAEFNNIILDSGANFSGGTGGGKFLSGGTDLYNIFVSSSDGNDITRVQPGSNIITGGTANNPTISVTASPSFNSITASGSSIFTTLSATTFFSGGTPLSSIISSYSGTSGNLWSASTGSNSIIANNGTGNIAIDTYAAILAGASSSVFSSASTIVGGYSSLINTAAEHSVILGGSGHTISGLNFCSTIGGINNLIEYVGGPLINYYSSAIIGGSGNTIASAENSIILGGRGNGISARNSAIIASADLSITDDYTVGMTYVYIDGYVDLNPQTTLPTASQGRMFFSGSPLFKLMINTGGTAADWAIV